MNDAVKQFEFIEIEGQGRVDSEFFCYYKYKDESEAYEGRIMYKQIQQAIDSGAKFVDEKKIFKDYHCDHEWIIMLGCSPVCNKCGIYIEQA